MISGIDWVRQEDRCAPTVNLVGTFLMNLKKESLFWKGHIIDSNSEFQK